MNHQNQVIFEDIYKAFLQEFGKGKRMVLSTSLQDHVTSRMMSVVQREGIFYFQTDSEIRKYKQLSGNPRVALCIENIQIEGLCREIGRPPEDSERLFAVTPLFIERWMYLDGKPFVEELDVERQIYMRREYACS